MYSDCLRGIGISALLMLLWGCGERSPTLDSQLQYWIDYHGIEGQQFTAAVDIHSAEARLGKLLFFSTSLSGSDDVACVTCHHPMMAGGDQLPLPIGVGAIDRNVLGRERQGNSKPLVPRNSPTTFNSSLWQRRMFYDGRIERLQHSTAAHTTSGISTPDVRYGDIDSTVSSLIGAQAGFPVTSEHEMRSTFNETASNQRIRRVLVENLVADVERDRLAGRGDNSWDQLFLQLYPQEASRPLDELLDFERVQNLLSAYEQSQVFMDTPWNRYLLGDQAALSQRQKAGAVVFHTPVEQGGGGCVACHQGALLSDEEFHVLAVPHAGIGKDINEEDTGRFLRTGIYDDRYAFRTPSLINIEHTAPYGHSGVFDSLEAMIRHHLDPQQSVASFDFDALSQRQSGLVHPHSREFSNNALAQLTMLRQQGNAILQDARLSDQQIEDLMAFMTALTDPCVESSRCLNPWLPNTGDANPGGSLIGLDISTAG
ncbi:cytochrome-c peroxidase [Candidatus Thalassolituus haligoni]|uniref:cytochrome-c peroxidase n=1 Tax=Candidatus Thalassolituus haligoni TaxID=3100113 RepID=UPI0035160BC5